MLSTLTQDLTFAVRQCRRSPAFTATAVLTLALGIGATTAIFSLVDGVLLHPLPFPHSDQLVAIDTLEFQPGTSATNLASAHSSGSSYPNFFDWQRQNHTLESLASCDLSLRLFSKPDGEDARVMRAARISANLFSTLGGLYAVLSHIVAERTRELGLRIALGASRPEVLRIVLRRSLMLSCIAVAIGALTSGFAIKVIAGTLFNVAAHGLVRVSHGDNCADVCFDWCFPCAGT